MHPFRLVLDIYMLKLVLAGDGVLMVIRDLVLSLLMKKDFAWAKEARMKKQQPKYISCSCFFIFTSLVTPYSTSKLVIY